MATPGHRRKRRASHHGEGAPSAKRRKGANGERVSYAPDGDLARSARRDNERAWLPLLAAYFDHPTCGTNRVCRVYHQMRDGYASSGMIIDNLERHVRQFQLEAANDVPIPSLELLGVSVILVRPCATTEEKRTEVVRIMKSLFREKPPVWLSVYREPVTAENRSKFERFLRRVLSTYLRRDADRLRDQLRCRYNDLVMVTNRLHESGCMTKRKAAPVTACVSAPAPAPMAVTKPPGRPETVPEGPELVAATPSSMLAHPFDTDLGSLVGGCDYDEEAFREYHAQVADFRRCLDEEECGEYCCCHIGCGMSRGATPMDMSSWSNSFIA